MQNHPKPPKMNLSSSLILLLLSLLSTNAISIRIPNNPIRLFSSDDDVKCISWRLAVEVNNNLEFRDTIPDICQNYIGRYILDGQYAEDVTYVAKLAYKYAKGIKLSGNGTDVFVFDVDDTLLSNMPYKYPDNTTYWAKSYNKTEFVEWELKGEAPAVPGMVKLTEKLLGLGFKLIFITGKSEGSLLEVTKANLVKAGFHDWEKLMLRGANENTKTKVEYKTMKRKQVVKMGYKIWGNIGDQWSDLLGKNAGHRTFKLPMPVFYSP